MRLFVFLHSDFLSRMSHCVAVQCMGILGKCFPNIFTPALADEIIAFQILYLSVNTASTASVSPISYLQFVVDNELCDSFARI